MDNRGHSVRQSVQIKKNTPPPTKILDYVTPEHRNLPLFPFLFLCFPRRKILVLPVVEDAGEEERGRGYYKRSKQVLQRGEGNFTHIHF